MRELQNIPWLSEVIFIIKKRNQVPIEEENIQKENKA